MRGRARWNLGMPLLMQVRSDGPSVDSRVPDGWGRYWPFSNRTTAEATEYPRGCSREAYTSLPAQSRLHWLKAELWLDSIWVTLLATSYFSATPTTVLRWTAEAFTRLPRGCSATLARYAKMMGLVDRFNRQVPSRFMSTALPS